MKIITKRLVFVLIVMSVFSFAASSADYSKYWSSFKNKMTGTPTAFTTVSSGEYGRLIWKQDFESGNIGDYYYDASYDSPYSDYLLSDNSSVFVSDGDNTDPTFTLVNDPTNTGHGKVLSMLGKTTYPIYRMSFKNKVLSKPGKYTFVANAFNKGESFTGRHRMNMNDCYDGAPASMLSFGTSSAFGSSVYSFTVVTPEEFTASGTDVTAYTTTNVTAMNYMFLYIQGGNGKTCFFDDLELWYEEYADITFDINAPEASVSAAMAALLPVTHKSYAPGIELPCPDISETGYDFIGWTTVKGDAGKTVTEASAGVATLYALYEKNENYEEDTGYIEELDTTHSKYFTHKSEYHGSAIPLTSSETSSYGKLIWKQDFETGNVGDYYYDPSYKSDYSLGKASLSNPVYTFSASGDDTNPEFTVVNDPTSTGHGKVLKMYDTKNNYPIYKLVFKGDIISKPGKYTFVGEGTTLGETFGLMFRFNPNRAYDGVPAVSFNKGTASSFGSTSYTFTVVTPEEFESSGISETTVPSTDNFFALQYIYFHIQNRKGTTSYYDNLKLYYEEYADVTHVLDAPSSAVEAAMLKAMNTTHKSYAPGSEIAKPDISGTGYKFVGWSTEKGNASKTVTNASAGKATLYGIYETDNTEYDDGYIEELAKYESKFSNGKLYRGTATPFETVETDGNARLIYRQDFESGYMGDYNYDPSYISPYALGNAKLSSPVYVYNGDGDGTNPTFSIIDDPTEIKGGKVLSMTGKSGYPIYRLVFKGDVLSKPGKYTIKIHANRGSNTNNGNVRFYVNRLYDGVPEMGGMNFTNGEFAETAYSFTVVNPEEFKESGLPEDTYSVSGAFAFQYVYFFMRSFNGKTVYFDDIEVWYEEYADIEFHLEGPTAEVTEAAKVTFGSTSRSFEQGKKLPSVSAPGTGYVFAGWTTAKGDSSKIVDTAKAEYTDLYALYEEANGRELVAYNEKLTVYEAIILVSRLNAEISGNKLDADATFSECLAYAEDEELLPQTAFDRYDRAILRSEMAEMLYAALPEDVREEINSIGEIPDVKEYDNFEEAVLALYKAGIFMGTDAEGSFDSYDGILRADFDTLVSRILFEENRVSFSLDAQEIKSIMLYNKQHDITASFISAPASFTDSFNEYPESQYELGNWVSPGAYTRTTMRRDFTVSKTVKKAVLELQCDSYTDFYINGHMYTAQKEGLWYLTGVVDITEHVVSGNNKMALRMYLSDSPEKFLVAFRGVIVLTYTDGTTESLTFDRSWHSKGTCGFWGGTEAAGWYTEDLSTFNNARGIHYNKYHPRALRRGAYFRTTFDSSKEVESATLYSGAKGLYVPYLNGERVTDNRFIPGSMDGLTEYQVFDVTKLIKNGTNVIAAETGNGWFNCASWGSLGIGQPAVMMQLEIKYTDGTTETVKTDNTWLTTVSPRTEDDIQFGERYDARLEIDGWNSAKNPDGTWVNAEALDRTLKPFANQTYPAVRIQNEARAVSMGTLADGTTYYDFRYNSTGRAKIVLKNTKPGEMVIVRYCEIVENGVPYVGTYGDVYFEQDTKADGKSCYGARNIDVYICKGAEEEVYIPEFAFTGFRYVYIYGYSGEYDLSTVRKIEMNTDLEQTGDIVTSHPGISKIWDAVKRSWRSNIVTGPMDCPTREKNFWNGDIQVFASTASWYMNTNEFLARWTEAGRKIEYGVYGWEDEEYILPLTLYRYYGNKDVIETKYPVVQNLITKRKGSNASGWLPSTEARYGDHQAADPVDKKFFTDAYYCYMFKSAAEMAEILGKTEDVAKYKAEFEACRASFNTKYFVPSENRYSSEVQGGIVFPIAFGIADESTLPALAETLNKYVIADDYHLTTGFMGNEFNMGILCDYGYGETAWKAITNDSRPSLLHMLSTFKGGTTTEGWGGYNTSSGSSMNHYSVGCLSRWFFEHLGGIRITSPGFKTVSIKPYFFEEMGDCDVTYMSDYGLIESKWVYNKSTDLFSWAVTVPDGITADVSLPEGVEFVSGSAGKYTNGTFEFTAKKNGFVPVEPEEITYASAPAAYDENYGHLVYFNNFKDAPTGSANLALLDVGTASVISGRHVVKGNNENTASSESAHRVHGIEIVSADGLGEALKYKDGTPITGDITVLYHAYNADSSAYNMYNVANDTSVGSTEWVGYNVDWSAKKLNAISWTSWASKTITVSDTLTRFGARAGALNKNVYFHSIAVYVKSDSIVTLVDEKGEGAVNVTLSGENFVIPSLFGDKAVKSWTDGSSVYEGGSSVKVLSVAGKMLKVKEYANLAVLKGKNIVCIGDSLTQGDYGSNPAGTMNVKAENYPYFLENFTGANVTNVGKCGYSAQLYYNYLPNIADKLNDSTDIVIIMLGTNNGLTDTIDADTASGNPNTYSSTQTGYYARIIEHVAEKAPNAQIILMTPPVTTLRNKATLETTCAVIKKFGEKYGLQVIDNYNNCGITYDNIKTYMPIDELHCGYDGYKLLASYVALKTAEYHEEFADSYALDYAELADEEMGFVGRWYDKTVNGVKCKATISQGAEMFFKAEGTSKVALRLHSTAQQAPTIAVSVDGSEPVRMTTAKTGDFTVAENLTSGEHYIRIIVDGFYEYQSNKWSTGDGFAVEKVVVDNGGNVTGLEPANPVILYYGDSITEGINVLGTGSTPASNSAIYEYPFVTSHLLGAVSYTNGFGASGVTKGGSGGVPKCLTVIDNVLADTPIDAPENPYAIVINHGHNDGSASAETFIAEYKAVLARLREKYPDTPVFAVVPYAQKRVTEIKTAVDSMNDSKIFYIATKGWEYTTTDGAHPDKAGAEKLGKRLAEEMGKILKAEEMRPAEAEIVNHTTKSLWHEGEVPFHLEEATNYATITPYIVDGSDEAVIIYPGGGYYQLSTVGEGSNIAKAYNEKGISAFVVTYRYQPYNGNAILADGQRAVQYVRYFAEDFGINPDKIAVLGFSAGGHLATMVCQHEPTENLAGDAIGELSSSPNAVLLGYAVTTLGDGTFHSMPGIFLGEENKTNAELIAKYSYSNDISKMPPAFIFYSTLDAAVNPQKNSVALATAMQNAGKTVEIHGYTDANHGVGLGQNYEDFSKWHNSSCEFLKGLGF